MSRLIIVYLAVLTAMVLFACQPHEHNSAADSPGPQIKHDFTSVNTTVSSRGVDVPVTYAEPVRTAKETLPLVVIAHGHGGHRHEHGGFTQLAERLAEFGVASIRMDFPGCGDSTESFAKNNLGNMLADLIAARDFALGRPAIDAGRVGLFGWSMGGRLVFLLSDRNDEFKAIATWTPVASNGPGSMTAFLGGQAEYDALKIEAAENGAVPFMTAWGQDQLLGLKWFEDLEASRPLDVLSNFEGPLLVLYGDLDDVVPPAVSEAAIESASSSSEVVRHVIEGADHGLGIFSDEPHLTEEAVSTVAEFLSERL